MLLLSNTHSFLLPTDSVPQAGTECAQGSRLIMDHGDEELPREAKLSCLAVNGSNITATVARGGGAAVVVLHRIADGSTTVLEPLDQAPLPLDFVAAEGMTFNQTGDQLLMHCDAYVAVVDIPPLHTLREWPDTYPVE